MDSIKIQTQIEKIKSEIATALPVLWGSRRFIGFSFAGVGIGAIGLWMLLVFTSHTPVVPVESRVETVPREAAVLGAFSARGSDSSAVLSPLPAGPNLPDFSDVTAESFLVYDEATGKILAERNKMEQLSVASLTKLMTGLLAYEWLDLSGTLNVEAGDTTAVRPVLGLRPGETVKTLDLFNAMIVGSANDAALALSNHVQALAGQKFPKLMNEKAALLDMQASRFSNPYGFDSWQNYSTAEDLRKLVDATQGFSAFRQLGRRTAFDFNTLEGRTLKVVATNKLVAKYPEVEAIKTGQTPEADGAIIIRASGKNAKIVIIVLGSRQREQDALLLKKGVLEAFEWK